jgi:hypothetical protein
MRMRKVMLWIGTAAMLVALVGGVAGSSSAATLTSGQYTYVINGEEFSTSDPVKVSAGLLLPIEVFQRFGITVSTPLTRSVGLKKASVTATITLGDTTFDLNGQPAAMDSAPMRLNGHLFVSADLLKHFGIEFNQDGTFVVLRDFTEGMPTVQTTSDDDFNHLRDGRTFNASVKADSGIYLNTDFTLLSPDLLAASSLDISYGTRARLQSMSQTNTLVLVKLSNTAYKAGAITANGFFLVDEQRRQYDLTATLDTGAGPITAKISPAADRTGVLIFPKVSNTATQLQIYYDANGATLGLFSRIR